jgi:hypothetical protein
MATTTTTAVGRQQPANAAMGVKKRALALHGARLLTWKAVLVRELHALHVQQQERAFMATTHGSIYASRRVETTVVH